MNGKINQIQDFLNQKAEFQAKLNLIPYKGTVEIKEIYEQKYLYIRKREAGKVKSVYIGPYSDELHLVLLKQVNEAKILSKNIRKLEKQLAELGYLDENLTDDVILNLDFARANMKSVIYDQAVLEGVSTTFPDTELILENGKVNNVNAEDVVKILNLKHAWEFILDKNVISSPVNYYVCQYIAKLVNEGIYHNPGKIREFPVTIGGSTYISKIPVEEEVKEKIQSIVNGDLPIIDIAIELALYVMKTQIFKDGNKRTAIIFANYYLISKGAGLLVVPYTLVTRFKELLVLYYENIDNVSIKKFLKEQCWRKFK